VAFDLLRIDERLIHGQVVVGWGSRLGIKRYVVVDDALAESDWEQELYVSALPDGVTARFLTTAAAVDRFDELDDMDGRGALLTRGTDTMRALAEAGCIDGRQVNVGGLHEGPGRTRILDYLYLGETERADLAAIAARARKVSARDLPTTSEVPLEDLLS
jgi:mannose/fructose/N-acetylgalactosamine-specific phosphotransferase system component IIB